MKKHTTKHGFTLVEIMIVVAIIGILAMISVPSFIRARERSRATAAASDLRAFEQAFHAYNLEYGQYPQRSFTPPYVIFRVGELPDAMQGYIKARNWERETPCGGQYSWTASQHSFSGGGSWGSGVRHYIIIKDGDPEMLALVGQEIDGVLGGRGTSGTVWITGGGSELHYFIDKITWKWPGVL